MTTVVEILGIIAILFVSYHAIRFAYYWRKAKRGIPVRLKYGPNAGKIVYVRHKIGKDSYVISNRPGGILEDIVSSDDITL